MPNFFMPKPMNQGEVRRVWHPESQVFKKWSREEGSNAADLSGVMPIEPLDLTQVYLNEACDLLAMS